MKTASVRRTGVAQLMDSHVTGQIGKAQGGRTLLSSPLSSQSLSADMMEWKLRIFFETKDKTMAEQLTMYEAGMFQVCTFQTSHSCIIV